MTTTAAPPITRSPRPVFADVLRSEWTKFRTIRGWVIGLLIAALLSVLFTFLGTNGDHEGGCVGPPAPGAASNAPGTGCYTGHPFVPTGIGDKPVSDSYYFVDQSVTGNITITARVTSLAGVVSTNPDNIAPSLAHTRPELTGWAKAGILLTPSTTQGSAYAAVMATESHGVRWQYDYTHDSPGRPATADSTSWLRIVRTGDTVSGYDSPDGSSWTEIGTTRFAGLAASLSVGMFVTSPVSFQGSAAGSATQATATFDHVSIDGTADPASEAWRGQSIGNGLTSFYPTLGTGGYHRAGGGFVISGSGDIALGVGKNLLGGDTAASSLLLGITAGLIAMIVVGAGFITVEYRRGLIRTTLTATPNRNQVVGAKAVVIGSVAFVTAAATAIVDLVLAGHLLRGNGSYVYPVSLATNVRMVVGIGAMAAATVVAVLALGIVLRKSAGAVTLGIVVFVMPYTLKQLLSGSAAEWVFRLTPAAGFDVLGALPRSARVNYPYTPANGYYPLPPWLGLAVLCAWAAIVLVFASFLLRRRDA